MKVIVIGTLAPATSGWWHDLVSDGAHGSTYVQALVGDRERWDTWGEIRRCNPLTAISFDFSRKLKEEREAARRDTRLKARFLSYRLNVPASDESEMLLTVDDFKRMAARPAPERDGRPIVGVDIGANRSWSAAVAIWKSGRIECMAVAPGIPDLAAQEKRDRVPGETYRKLADAGLLQCAEGLRVQPPALLWAGILEAWGAPAQIVCDRFRLADLQDAVNGAVYVEPRVTRWSDASADIRALRKGVLDGGFAIPAAYQPLLAASLAVASVQNDDSGNVRLVKKGVNNTSRDDVAGCPRPGRRGPPAGRGRPSRVCLCDRLGVHVGGCGKASGGPSWSVTAFLVGGVGGPGEWRLTISCPCISQLTTAWRIFRPSVSNVTGRKRMARWDGIVRKAGDGEPT